MVDFNRSAATAKRLVDKNGRDVTLVELDFDADNTSKPWRPQEKPRDTPASTASYRASFVPLAATDRLGFRRITEDMIKRSDATCLIGTSDNLEKYQELIDSRDGRRYKIMISDQLDPASPNVLWYLLLSR